MIGPALLQVLLLMGVASWGVERDARPIQQAEIAPVFYQPFACIDHPEGQLADLGDALGTDCLVVGGLGSAAGQIRFFDRDGSSNSDWFGWNTEVHAPFDGFVLDVRVNPKINHPGSPSKPPASFVSFRRSDGLVVVIAHVQDVRVRAGERVIAGQVVALDGNNGTAKAPHVHVAAYLGEQPLQIRWDLRAEGHVPTLRGN